MRRFFVVYATNLRHIWGDMMHYRPPIRNFFLGGGRVPPVLRGIFATDCESRMPPEKSDTFFIYDFFRVCRIGFGVPVITCYDGNWNGWHGDGCCTMCRHYVHPTTNRTETDWYLSRFCGESDISVALCVFVNRLVTSSISLTQISPAR